MQTNRSQEGMTIIEVIVAITIFALVSFAFLGVFSSSLLMTTRAGVREEGIIVATSLMENQIGDPNAEITGAVTAAAIVSITYPNMSNAEMSGQKVTAPSSSSTGQTVVIVGFIPQ